MGLPLSADFAACKTGKLQSPIDIRGAKPADRPRSSSITSLH